MGRRGRGDGSVYQRKDGSWVAQFQGKYRYAQTEDAAKLKLYKMLTGAEESKPNNITVRKLLDEYITHASINLKPRTVKRYREAIEVHLKPALGKDKLHELDAMRIEEVYAKKLEQSVSPSTIQLIHAVLSGALKRGVRLKLVQHNPCKDVEVPRIERAEVEPFTKEAAALLSAASKDRLRCLWVLSLTTGMRQGELVGLKAGDVDIRAGKLRITRTVYNGIVGTPKSKRSKRIIKLPHMAFDALTAHIGQGDYADDDWLFPSNSGKAMWASSFVEHHWQPLTVRAGIRYKNFHTCRHYVASTLLERGLPITAVARYLGHDENTLLRTYSHIVGDMQRLVATAMDEALG